MSYDSNGLAVARPKLQRLVDAVRARPDGGRVGLVVVDAETGERIDWAGGDPFTAASVIKVPILLAALRLADAGTVDLEQRVPRPCRDPVGGSGVLKELTSVHELSLRDLLMLMVIVSDNTATNTVLDVIGIEAVDALLRDCGLGSSRLERKLMDLAARDRGLDNVITAADIATLLAALVRGDVLTGSHTRTALDMLGRQQVRDRLPRYLPEGTRVAHKTGDLPGLRHDAGVLHLGPTGDHPVVVVVLTEGFADPLTTTDTTGGDASDLGADVGRIVHAAFTDHQPSGG
ncbi:MAG: serine hydrolase [Streptosporangiales bacterium]|nr:serine hydrolase [Streptosporangiales bacterium]